VGTNVPRDVKVVFLDYFSYICGEILVQILVLLTTGNVIAPDVELQCIGIDCE